MLYSSPSFLSTAFEGFLSPLTPRRNRSLSLSIVNIQHKSSLKSSKRGDVIIFRVLFDHEEKNEKIDSLRKGRIIMERDLLENRKN